MKMRGDGSRAGQADSIQPDNGKQSCSNGHIDGGHSLRIWLIWAKMYKPDKSRPVPAHPGWTGLRLGCPAACRVLCTVYLISSHDHYSAGIFVFNPIKKFF
jgi:hypothetical protein